jgi:hypothetical protein
MDTQTTFRAIREFTESRDGWVPAHGYDPAEDVDAPASQAVSAVTSARLGVAVRALSQALQDPNLPRDEAVVFTDAIVGIHRLRGEFIREREARAASA